MTKAEKETQKLTTHDQAESKKTTVDKKAKKTTDKQTTPKTIDDVLREQTKDDPQIEIKVTWTEVKPAYDNVLRQVAKTLKVDGFRPGKVPASVAEDRVRQEYLIGEVAKQVLRGRLEEAIKNSKQKPDVEPNVQITQAGKNKDWVFVVLLPQRTKVKLPEYKKFLSAKKKEIIKNLKTMQTEAEKKAQADKQKAPTALTEEQLKARATDEALMSLMQEIKPQISRTLVQCGAQQEYERLVDQLGQYQVTWADYLKNTGMSEEALFQQFSLRALESIQTEFVLDALMEAEKVTASEDELIAKMKEVMPDVVSEEEQKRQLSESSVRDYLELITKRQKLATWLLDL